MELFVEIEGKPKIIKWFRGTEELPTNSNQIQITNNILNNIYKLEIEKCELTDTGVYRIILSNNSQCIESSCLVNIYEEKLEKLSFIKELNDQTLSIV